MESLISEGMDKFVKGYSLGVRENREGMWIYLRMIFSQEEVFQAFWKTLNKREEEIVKRQFTKGPSSVLIKVIGFKPYLESKGVNFGGLFSILWAALELSTPGS